MINNQQINSNTAVKAQRAGGSLVEAKVPDKQNERHKQQEQLENQLENELDKKSNNKPDKRKGLDEVKSQLTNHWDMDQLPREEYERLMRQGSEQLQSVRQQQVKRFIYVVGLALAILVCIALLASQP